ncbi:DUF4238 domain-containing protein [Halomicroarcula sp. GCM10025709]|uniref:DUF4238 domain-containing protein n=1 Tax=Halomicroarcula sp. GCM10025709 TaxID=3252669 RepID=UPI003615042D
MVEYRNQHYVPEFLLEGWATEGRVVTLHFESGHEEPSQSISDICSRNYLYTLPHDTALEEELGNLEGRQAVPIKTLRKGGTPEDLSTQDMQALCSFIFTQRLRTRVYRGELLESGDQVYDIPLRRDFESLLDRTSSLSLDEKTYSAVRDGKIKAMARELQNYLMMHGLGLVLRDLDIVLAVNKTEEQFVCSDAPVVFDNIRFKHEREQYYPGAANRGFLAYCPISPNKYLILYDPFVYEFEYDTERRIQITDVSTAQLLNQMQVMNAGDIAVYASTPFREKLLEMDERAQDFRRYETIPKQIETSFERIEYEIPPSQPLPDSENPFQMMHVNQGISFSKRRSPKLSKASEKIVHELLDDSESTAGAAIRAIGIALEQFGQ